MKYLLKIFKFCVPIILICIGGLAILSLSMGHDMYQGLSDEDKMLYSFINKQGKVLGEKYHMKQCGNGLSGMDKLEHISLCFDQEGDPLTEKEARKLIIHCIDDFLKAINSNEKLKPLLKEYPFTPKNLELTIFSYDKDRALYYFPSIAVVSDSSGEIGFMTKIESVKYGYHTEKYETYEEAKASL